MLDAVKCIKNDHVQYAIDVMLFRHEFESASAGVGLRQACESVFVTRAMHAWPPQFIPPGRWRDQYARMSGELSLVVASLNQASAELQRFVNAIAAATSD